MKAYEKLTEKFIDLIEQKENLAVEPEMNIPMMPMNFVSKSPYKGANVMILFMVGMIKGFGSGYYLTFNQIRELGGRVKKDETAFPVIFFNFMYKKDGKKLTPKQVKSMSQDELDECERIPFAKYRNVFNFDQTEGIEIDVDTSHVKDIMSCDSIIENCKVIPSIRTEAIQPYYNKVEDFINMPQKSIYPKSENYYNTLFHEMIHSTGHESRLNRPSLIDSINEAGIVKQLYNEEELVAELGGAMLSSVCGIDNDQLKINSACYLKHYLDKMKVDTMFLYKVAKDAKKAVDYILGE